MLLCILKKKKIRIAKFTFDFHRRLCKIVSSASDSKVPLPSLRFMPLCFQKGLFRVAQSTVTDQKCKTESSLCTVSQLFFIVCECQKRAHHGSDSSLVYRYRLFNYNHPEENTHTHIYDQSDGIRCNP